LRNDAELTAKLRQKHEDIVRPEQGRSMANRIGAFDCFECSSKTREGVEAIFRAAAKASITNNNATNNNKKKKSEKCLLQ
jgi:Ras family protein A